jgi:uncharacterized protein (TIGR02391 family)
MPIMDRGNLMQQLEELLADFKNNYSLQIEELTINSEKMKGACDRIRDSWSGSCFGYHSKLYYGDFEKPPRDEKFSVVWGGIHRLSEAWRERTPEDVKAKIAQLVGNTFSVDTFEKDNDKLAGDIEDFETHVVLFISSITGSDSNHPLAGIEKVEPRKKLEAYMKSYISGSRMTRDSEAYGQGIIMPAIIYYDAVVYEAESIVSNIQQFLKASKHFMRWYKLQATTRASSDPHPPLTDLSLLHPDIFSKCQHLFETGAYPEAVEKSFKVFRDRLRNLTGHETGSEAFGKGKLHIKGAAAANVDHDFNEGVKFLTMALDKFRNEKSHTSDGNITDPQHAYEYLTISSLAMHLLDRAEIKSN